MRWRMAIVLALLACGLAATSSSGEPTSDHVHFTAVGDYAANTATTGNVLNALAANGTDAHLALGDMSYGATGAEEDWCSFVKQRLGDSFPFELISGNHESNGQNGNINDFSACLPNQLPGLVGTYGRQWYVDVPRVNPLVRFIMISPGIPYTGGTWNYTVGSPRYQWTSDAIDSARTKSIPWVVVGMHKPCLSLGEYSCESGADINNLMLSKKVDLVLSGHEHIYQRTKQLGLGAACPSLTIGSYNPGCVVDADNTLAKGAGTVFTTIGTGGIGQRDVNASDPEAGYFVASAGANQNLTYGFGDFDVTPDKLTASFVRGTGGTFTDAFTIDRSDTPPANQPPTASFTSSSAGLTASFDGSASADTDGTIASYAWDFGDGTTGTTATPSRTYAASGTYTVTLTVTDDDGATATTSKSVTVTAPPPAGVLAKDEFERTVSSGWGSADTGGPWTIRGTASAFSVGGGAGKLAVAAGKTLYADLTAVSSTSSRLDTEFSFDKALEGQYLTLVGRQIGADSYFTTLKVAANGSATLKIQRGTDVMGTTAFTPGFTFVPGTRYRLALQVKGTSPTTVSAKVWRASDAEPAWQRTATNSYAALQAKGQVGLYAYLSSAAAGGPGTVSFWQFSATDAG